MKSFFDNLFGKKSEPPKIQERAKPVRQNAVQREEYEFYKKGDVIGGKYEVLGTVGKGGFGVVFLVHDRSINVVCALKTFRDELLTNSATKEAFKKEALLWVNLERHPFVLTAQWVEEVFGRLFVAMEYIAPDAQGRVSLADHLARAVGPLDTNQVLEWAIQFCLGMEHAKTHGVECHGDIKPANILITQHGTLKITDFGLAAAAEMAWCGTSDRDGSLVIDGAEGGFSLMQVNGKVRCGTPGYIAPEVYRCEGSDTRSDIYSFGLVLWQMAAGSHVPPFAVPWPGDMESYLRAIYEQQMAGRLSRLEGSLGPVIERCLRLKPSDRYLNFKELRGDLDLIWLKRTGKKFEIPQIGDTPAGLWVNKGMSLTALGRHKEAIGCYDKALAIDPLKADAWIGKGVALDNLGRYKEAIDCYDRALTIDPRNAPGWINKGFPLEKLGRHEEAIGCYDKALAIDPQKANAWIGKGNILRQLGRHEEAIRCHSKALTIDPRNAHAWNNKGNALRSLNKNEDALDCFNKALEINPHYADAWFNKALTHGDIGLEVLQRLTECEGWQNRPPPDEALQHARDAATSYRNFIKVAPPEYAKQIELARQRLEELKSYGAGVGESL